MKQKKSNKNVCEYVISINILVILLINGMVSPIRFGIIMFL